MGKAKKKALILALLDLLLINLSLYGAFWIRFDGSIPSQFINSFFSFALIFSLVRLTILSYLGLHHRLWRYASIGELTSVIAAVAIGSAVAVSIFVFLPFDFSLPRGVVVLDAMLNVMLIGGSRLAWRLFSQSTVIKHSRTGKPVLIFGAGDAGIMVARELRNHYNGEINLVGFLDDDLAKKNASIMGLPVLGGREALPQLIKENGVQEVIIAMPSVPGKAIREIVSICQDLRATVKILPGVYDLIEGNVTFSKIREVQVEDLLSREPVKLDMQSIGQYIEDQVVLVTGGGGSIGSELCRQIAKYKPGKLLVYDNCENNVYDIEMELRKKYPALDLRPFVKDVRDRTSVEEVFRLHRPKVVFHAAAHKHVPLMEVNPEEAIKNNVMGTYNVARAADLFGAQRFVLISTDKAVNPTSVMGASKRVAEMVIQHLNSISETNYAAVRFGNVLGSRGSVIPLFKKQIAEGGPVTVTHKDMIRYFMTIPEAVQLVLQAGAMTEGGELFVLDMGDQVRIWDLAETLVKLSGFEPGEDMEIVEVGMRPGEKLYEELLTAEEGVNSTKHKRIFVARPCGWDAPLLERVFQEFIQGTLPKSEAETVRWLREFLPEFHLVRYGVDGEMEESMKEAVAAVDSF